jgi:PAS domain-containing protein
VVLSLVDIDALRHEIERTRWARDYARAIVEAVQVPLLVLDAGLVVLSANAACYQLLREAPETLEGRGLFDLGVGEWDTSALRAAVAGVAARPGPAGRFQGLALHRDPDLGRRHACSRCAVPTPSSEADPRHRGRHRPARDRAAPRRGAGRSRGGAAGGAGRPSVFLTHSPTSCRRR